MLHYGTDELIALIRRAARTVYRRYHTPLSVGDISASRGGPALHHASHQSGRDADLAFFVLDRQGRSARLSDYVGFRGDGHPMVGDALRFDTVRNWALIEALLTDPETHVEHVFVSNPIRALLLAHARATGESPGTIARAESAMHQPVHGSPHANHFHVRIACPSGDGACVEGLRPAPRPRRRGRAVARGDQRHGHSHHQQD
jgi:penicillin-insensitive murein endopeptidase